MKCHHIGKYQHIPEEEMIEQGCVHTLKCPVCEYSMECISGCSLGPKKFKSLSKRMLQELDVILRESIE